MPNTPVASVNSSLTLPLRNYKYQHGFCTVGWSHIQEQQVVSQNEITLPLGIEPPVDFRHPFGSHVFIQSALVGFQSPNPSDDLAYNWVLHLSIDPVPVHEVPEMFVLSNHLLGPQDHLLFSLTVFCHYSWVICLCLGNITGPGMIEECSDGFQVQPLRDPAQNVCNLVVGTLQVFNGHVIPSKCGYPLVSKGIQVKGSHHVSEGIIIGAYHEGFVPEVLFELVGYGPLESQELQLGRMVLPLTSF